MNFVDHAKISVKAGKGGNGCIAFLREKFRPKGGPCGGDGGHGGSVILQTDENLSTLHDLKYNKKYIANNGENGKGKNMHGKNGADIIISVPIGTIIKHDFIPPSGREMQVNGHFSYQKYHLFLTIKYPPALRLHVDNSLK